MYKRQLLVAVQPPVCVVTVNVYVPTVLTVGVAVFPFDEIEPPLLAAHKKFTFGVDEEPFSTTVELLQSSTLFVPAFAFGVVHVTVLNGTYVIATPH